MSSDPTVTAPANDPDGLRELVDELARRIEHLETENRELRAALPSAERGTADTTGTTDDTSTQDGGVGQAPVSRRRAILGLGAAAAAGAAAVAAASQPAAAANGDAVLLGQQNTFSNSLPTHITNSTGRALELNGNSGNYGLYSVGSGAAGVRSWGYSAEGLVATGLDIPTGTGREGIVGYGFNANYAGVRGNNANSGPGVQGESSTGLGGQFTGGRAAIRLVPTSTAGAPTSGEHRRGEMVVDKTGKLFVCTSPGTPGSWARVNTTAV